MLSFSIGVSGTNRSPRTDRVFPTVEMDDMNSSRALLWDIDLWESLENWIIFWRAFIDARYDDTDNLKFIGQAICTMCVVLDAICLYEDSSRPR